MQRYILLAGIKTSIASAHDFLSVDVQNCDVKLSVTEKRNNSNLNTL